MLPHSGLLNIGYSIGNDSWEDSNASKNRYLFVYYGSDVLGIGRQRAEERYYGIRSRGCAWASWQSVPNPQLLIAPVPGPYVLNRAESIAYFRTL